MVFLNEMHFWQVSPVAPLPHLKEEMLIYTHNLHHQTLV